MENKKIDITSTAIEKGFDLVKDFVEKLVGSTLEETGLLISDNIKLIRFKNQLKILTKAQKIVKESGINIKQISLKSLVPLLEYSSLEEDETLQEKWANLLVNFIDSSEKYESTIFPFILNQLSSKEIIELERLFEVGKSSLEAIKFSGIEIANIVRLGLMERVIDEGKYIYSEKEKPRIRYKLTSLGKEFVKCCSPKAK